MPGPDSKNKHGLCTLALIGCSQISVTLASLKRSEEDLDSEERAHVKAILLVLRQFKNVAGVWRNVRIVSSLPNNTAADDVRGSSQGKRTPTWSHVFFGVDVLRRQLEQQVQCEGTNSLSYQ